MWDFYFEGSDYVQIAVACVATGACAVQIGRPGADPVGWFNSARAGPRPPHALQDFSWVCMVFLIYFY